MLACLIQRTRSTRLDDMVTMLSRFIGRIEAKARAELEAWHLERRVNVVEMVGVLHDIARLRRDRPDDAPDLALKIDAIFQQAGGLERIISACVEHLGSVSLPPRCNGRRSELLKTDRGGAGYGQDVVVWARAIPTGNRLGQGTQYVPVFGRDASCSHCPNPGVAI